MSGVQLQAQAYSMFIKDLAADYIQVSSSGVLGSSGHVRNSAKHDGSLQMSPVAYQMRPACPGVEASDPRCKALHISPDMAT